MNIHDTRAVGLDLDGNLTEAFTSTPLPGVTDCLDVLRAHELPLRVLTNQAGCTWGMVTGDTKYPTIDKLARQLIQSATALGLRDIPWYVSVYDPVLVGVLLRRYQLAAADADADHPELAMPENAGREAQAELLQYARQAAIALGTLLASYGMAHWKVSADPTWRKPKPGMMLAMSKEIKVPLWQIAYVGDMDGTREIPARSGRFPDSDRAFAEAAGCGYFAGSMETFIKALESSE